MDPTAEPIPHYAPPPKSPAKTLASVGAAIASRDLSGYGIGALAPPQTFGGGGSQKKRQGSPPKQLTPFNSHVSRESSGSLSPPKTQIERGPAVDRPLFDEAEEMEVHQAKKKQYMEQYQQQFGTMRPDDADAYTEEENVELYGEEQLGGGSSNYQQQAPPQGHHPQQHQQQLGGYDEYSYNNVGGEHDVYSQQQANPQQGGGRSTVVLPTQRLLPGGGGISAVAASSPLGPVGSPSLRSQFVPGAYVDTSPGMPVVTSVRTEDYFGTARHSEKRANRRGGPHARVTASGRQVVSPRGRPQSPLNNNNANNNQQLWRSDEKGRQYRVTDPHHGHPSAAEGVIMGGMYEDVKEENRQLKIKIQQLEQQNGGLVQQYSRTHQALTQAGKHMELQQTEIYELKKCLGIEVNDNDHLKTGFLELIRKANSELTKLRTQIDYRDRKDRYDRDFMRAQVTQEVLSGIPGTQRGGAVHDSGRGQAQLSSTLQPGTPTFQGGLVNSHLVTSTLGSPAAARPQ